VNRRKGIVSAVNAEEKAKALEHAYNHKVKGAGLTSMTAAYRPTAEGFPAPNQLQITSDNLQSIESLS
jgi:hypothetical protein